MRTLTAWVLAAAVCGLGVGGAGVARAQDEKPLDARLPVPQWKVRFDLMAWYAAPGGKLTLPTSGGGRETKLEVLDMDNPRLSPLGELDLRMGNWRFSFGGFSFQGETAASGATEGGQIGDFAFNTGDQVRTHLDFQSFELTAGYRVWDVALNPGADTYALVLGVDVIGGGRIYDTSVAVGSAGAPLPAEQNEFFGEPVLGVKADFDFYRAFSIYLRTTAGYFPGDNSTWSWDIALTGVYRPMENVGILVGYRQLLFDLESGSGNGLYRFRGGIAGLYAGLELRF